MINRRLPLQITAIQFDFVDYAVDEVWKLDKSNISDTYFTCLLFLYRKWYKCNYFKAHNSRQFSHID